MLQFYGIISAILSIISYIPYIRDIFRKKTKPQRMSWFIWLLLGYIAFFSLLLEGATNSLWLAFIEGLGITIVFLLSLKYGVGGAGKYDKFALIFTFIALFVWYLTKNPAIALIISLLINAAGELLTIKKAYRAPESETLITWLLAGISGIFSMLSVGKLDLILLSYPFYICIANLAVVLAINLGKSHLKKANRSSSIREK